MARKAEKSGDATAVTWPPRDPEAAGEGPFEEIFWSSSDVSASISWISIRGTPVSLFSKISSLPPLPTRLTTTSAVATPAAGERVDVERELAERAGRHGLEDRAGEGEEGERVACGRRVEDDEVVARLLRRAARPLQHLADLPEQEKVGQARCRPGEEAERREGEHAIAQEADRRDGADEVREERVEVGRDRPEVLPESRLGVAAVLAPEEGGGIAPPVRGHEEDGAAPARREGGKRRRDGRLPDAALARDGEKRPRGEVAEEVRCAQAGPRAHRKRDIIGHSSRWRAPSAPRGR